MPDDERTRGKSASGEETGGGLTDLQQRVLDEQQLVNERKTSPQRFGGMTRPPVETAAPPPLRQGAAEKGETVEPGDEGDQDIQMEGS